MTNEAHDNALHGRHRAVAIWCAVLVAAMVGAAYASVPLYRLFCQVTGFDGTPRIATEPSDHGARPDRHHPLRCQRGARPALALRAGADDTPRSRSARTRWRSTAPPTPRIGPSAGMATFNVFPEQVAPFFNKLQCFCFTEQLLQPGESAGDAGELLRRPADRGRQGCLLGARTSRCPIRSIPRRRRSRGSPARTAVLRHRKRCNATGKPGRFAIRGLSRRPALPRQRGSGSR